MTSPERPKILSHGMQGHSGQIDAARPASGNRQVRHGSLGGPPRGLGVSGESEGIDQRFEVGETDEAVGVFGISKDSIRNWQARYDQGGIEALRSCRPGRKAGECTKLSPSEEQALVGALVEYDPDTVGVGGKLWTAMKVCLLARRLFGASFTDRGMRKLLRRLGFSFQRPDRCAIEADAAAQWGWAERAWTELLAQAASEGARIMFLDQVGVRSDHLSGRTWGC